MTRLIALGALAPAALLLIAADAPPYSKADPGCGMTVETNIVAQVIDMTPQYADVPPAGSNGKRSVDAYRRYQTGNVKKLLTVDGGSRVGGQGGANEQVTVITQPNN
jgi:hypothetical protein